MAQTFNGKPGDLIEINRGPYNQWAVYIGENEVVYFTTEEKHTGVQSSGSSASLSSSPGKVKRETFKNVVGNDRYQVNNLLDKTFKARDPSVIEKEACAMVGRELEYDNKTYNCEHFAIEMRYGKAESRQFNGKPGDLIEIFRKDNRTYQHWAVYIGENEVVHLVNEAVQSSGWFKSLRSSSSGSHGKVKREKLTEVVGNDRYEVNNLLDDRRTAHDPFIIVDKACAMVGPKQYNVVTNNCEHFATQMRYGVAASGQVKAAVVATGVASTAGVAVGAGAAIAGAPVVAAGAAGAVVGGGYALCKALSSSRSSS